MSFANVPGGSTLMIGAGLPAQGLPTSIANTTIDAANEAVIVIGRVCTSDGASHTIDTTGSSSLGWRSGSVTFANAGTTVKVGLASADTANGPPGRAANVANVVTFDVSAVFVGGGGGITANAWQTSVPTAGTKTIANGDLVAFVVQMTARGGVDSVVATMSSSNTGGTPPHEPIVTQYTGGSYAISDGAPRVVITFSDGAIGWFQFGDVANSVTARTFNSGSAPNEYGQLFNLPFPVRISGLFGFIDPDANYDLVLYSTPLGTPVAQKTLSFDLNTASVAAGRRVQGVFPSPYDVAGNTDFAVVVKPTSVSNMSAYYKTLVSATHRVADPWGTNGYGVSRSGGSGAFANANSSLDHYYVGIIAGGFEVGGSSIALPPVRAI